MILLYVALMVNVAVAGYWGVVLSFGKTEAADTAFGVDTPARRILASVYLAIALLSGYALIFEQYALAVVAILFPLQILYKSLTALVVRDIRNPVVISNLLIAVLLALSLFVAHS